MRMFMMKLGFVIAVALGTVAASAAAPEGFDVRTKAGSYEDVKFDLTNAIIDRGLVVDFTGNVAGMLDRTGADVGSTKTLYRNGEYFIFCSARLSRGMMEADPANLSLCPFVVFIYEREDKPGEIVVGFRNPADRGGPDSVAAIGAVRALLAGIISDATK